MTKYIHNHFCSICGEEITYYTISIQGKNHVMRGYHKCANENEVVEDGDNCK